MKTKCFFNDCEKEVNQRGKFCTYHDQKEIDANKEISAIFESMADKAVEQETTGRFLREQ